MSDDVNPLEMKEQLHGYLRRAREAVLWKLEGLGEYDLRRPLTPTGTSLLGLVKHLAGVEGGYFGDAFGRPFPEGMAVFDDDDPNADLWARADESREEITSLYRRACEHADATIEARPLDAVGSVPWWPEGRREATLHRLLAHVLAETNRHAGHADIVRELIDGAAGLSPEFSNVPPMEGSSWEEHHALVERAAKEAAGGR